MTAKPVFVTDIFGEIVAKVNAKLLPALQEYDTTIVGINYQYGEYKEVFGTLVQQGKEAGGAKKYPLVWLWMPITLDVGGTIGVAEVSPLRIIIARWGNNTDKTAERYTNNFKPVLYPIYLELLNQLSLDPRIISDAKGIPHRHIDWPYWGGDSPSEEANPFSDYVDAIELKDVKLNLLLKNCY